MNFSLKNKLVLITGIAGFIGSKLADYLLKCIPEIQIVGIDNMNSYYDISLKKMRLMRLKKYKNFQFIKGDIACKDTVMEIFKSFKPIVVVNLAAQAGVRYSIDHPDDYIESNIVGFFHVLEACRRSLDEGQTGVKHLVYASSSSVYGMNQKIPYSTQDRTDKPASLYAATKRADELMAYAYSKLYAIPTTGLRFFTVYGPEGRPDMAYFHFTNQLVKGEKLRIFNNGNMYRDFTYIDDAVMGIEKVLKKVPGPDAEGVPYKLYNIGNHQPQKLLTFVETLEKCLMEQGVIEHPGEKEFLPMQIGDVYQTYADIEDLEKDTGFHPSTGLYEGLSKFVSWYVNFYQ